MERTILSLQTGRATARQLASFVPIKPMPHTIPLLMSIDETFDIGMDTRTAVDDSYTLPFRFNGTINKLTFKLGPSQLTPADQKAVDDAAKNVNN
jgi:arylsulfatase